MLWLNKQIAVFLTLVFLAGCGFQPLHGGGGSVDTRLALQQVEINLIKDREGQILHNFLLDRFNPRGRARNPAYYLSSEISISESSLGVSRNATTTRAKLIVTVDFKLSGSEGKSRSFTIRRISGYSQTQSEYESQVAKDDAIQRSLREIANDARSRVSAYLKTDSLG